MAFVYYCTKCKKILTSEFDDEYYECSNCGTVLTVTHMSEEEWNSRNKDGKVEIKKQAEPVNSVEKKPTEHVEKRADSSENANTIGVILKMFGWVYLILDIAGAFLIADDWGIGLAVIIGFVGLLGGFLLMGFGEVINLLQDLKNKKK